jgi:H+/Cl- antiporter ClcA
VAVVIAGMVSLGLAGDYLYFGALHDTLSLPQACFVVPVVAVLGGVAGGTFARSLLMASSGALAVVRAARQRPVLLAFGCGVLVALIGVATGGLTWGTGYAPAKALVEGVAEPVWLAPAKFVASLATAVSGIPGGIFAPALSTGAALGGLLSGLFPGVPLGSIVLLGMTAYFVGVVRAPLTSVVIVMEMTDSRSMLVMLLAAALIADAAASLICRERLYAGLARGFRSGAPASTAPAP